MWANELNSLSHNHEVISIDLPGFGKSPLRSQISTMSEMASKVLDTLNQIGVKEKFFLSGVSMGGYVAFQVLKHAPDKIRALGLISTQPAADTPEARENRFKTISAIEKNGITALAEKMLPNLLGKTSQRLNLDLVNSVQDQILKANPAGVIAALKGMAEREDSTPLLPQIKIPVLVVSGEEDSLITTQKMRDFSAQIPHVRFETISSAGHLLNLEKPVEFLQIFQDFVSTL